MKDDIDGLKATPARRANRDQAFEVTFGQRVKAVRIAARMSQTALAEVIGLSFQQVQKYESGKDRVSVSTLQAIAKAFGVHPGSFFDDMPVPTGPTLNIKNAMRVGEIAQRIQNPTMLKRLTALMEELAASEERAMAEHDPITGSGPH